MKELKLGTRGSPLALTQTNMVKDALLAVQPDLGIEVVIIQTSGDWKPEHGETPLKADAGGKALFAKEIEEALLSGRVDAAVHSMKDMETFLPDGLVIPWMLPREDVREALILPRSEKSELSNSVRNIFDLPNGCVFGTTSVRRAAMVLQKRPDYDIQPIRGNVQTRIDKVRSGHFGASLLAYAGLKRMGLEHEAAQVIDVNEMLPAAAQGAVGIEICGGRIDEMSIFGQISCGKTVSCVVAERGVLESLGGSCHTPVSAYAVLGDDDTMHMRASVLSLDGQQRFDVEMREAVHDVEGARAFGRRAGKALKTQVPADILAEIF